MSNTITTNKFHPRVKHSLPYYNSVIVTLVEGLTNGLSDARISSLLNAKGILAPSGNRWTETAVSAALFKLRHFRTHPNRIHGALLQLIFDGFFKPSQVSILFEPRSKAVM